MTSTGEGINVKKTLKRTVTCALLGTTLAVGGATLAPLPANADVIVTTAAAPISVSVDQTGMNTGGAAGASRTIMTGRYIFNEAYSHLTVDYKIDKGDAYLEPAADFAGWTGPNSDTFVTTAGSSTYTFTKLSDTHLRMTFSDPISTYADYTVHVWNGAVSVVPKTSAPMAADVTVDLVSVTPKSTGVAEAQTSEPLMRRTLTFGDYLGVNQTIGNANHTQAATVIAINGVYTFAEYITNAVFDITATGDVTLVPEANFTGWTNNTFIDGKFTFQRISDTHIRVTVTDPTGQFSTHSLGLTRVLVQPNAPAAQTTITSDLISTTFVGGKVTTYDSEPQMSRTITWGNVVDTPVIAPAVAGIALLGAAGVGGGVFAARRKKAKANA
jgi:hypothetical protein